MAEILLGFLLGLAGLWLASRQGDTVAAGFALSSQIVGAATLLFRVINMGVSVVITQAKGASNEALARSLCLASLGASSRIGLAASGLLLALSPWLLLALGADPAVQAASTALLCWLALALALDGYCAAMGSVLRAQLRGAQAMQTSLVMHASHLAMSVPMMALWGIAGFGVAMLASRALAVALLLRQWRLHLLLKPAAQDWWAWRHDLLRGAMRIGLPGAAETIAYRLAALATVTVIADFGTASLAAHSYVQQLVTAVVLATVALGFACEIVVGHHVGAGDLRAAHRLVRRVLWFGLGFSTFAAFVNALLAPFTMRLFTQSAEVIALAAPALWVALALEPGRCCNVVLINALRGAGDAKFPVVVGAFSMVIVMAGGAWLLGAAMGWGLLGVWIALAADELLRGAIMWWRWESLHWLGPAKRMRLAARAI